MIPTFVGITLLAYFVMQLARKDAYETELQQARGAGQGGAEAGAASGSGSLYAGSLSLEQIERLQRRYEMHLPIALNFDVQDRSDRVNRSLDHLLAPVPPVRAERLVQLLQQAKLKEQLQELNRYLKDSQNPSLDWFYDEAFASSFAIKLAVADPKFEKQILSAWEELNEDLQVRIAFRQRRDRADRDLTRFQERLIPCLLPQLFDEKDLVRQSLAWNYLKKTKSLQNLESFEELRQWWQTHQEKFSQDFVEKQAFVLATSDAQSTEFIQAEKSFDEVPGLYAQALYEAYFEAQTLELRARVIDLFEKSTRAEGIPYIDRLEEKFVDLAWIEVVKWWRKNKLEFVEVGFVQKLGLVFVETRYGGWLADILRLDFRQSEYLGVPVLEAIKSRLPISIQFGLIGFILSYTVCIPLGVFKAIRHGSTFDVESSFLVFVGYSIPGWAFGAILLLLFGGGTFPEFDYFPLYGFQSDNFEQLSLWEKILDRAHHAVLPVMAYAVGSFATLTVLMKNSLMENLGADYVRTAFAKGLDEKRVIFVHTLRNSLIPLCTGLGHIMSLVLAGSYLVEKVFNIDGFGLMGYTALINFDINLLMGVLVIGSVLRLWGNLFSDILYALTDPRIRFK